MQYIGDTSLVVRNDYIWKVLRMQHVWMLLLSIGLTLFAIYTTYAFWNLSFIIGLCVFFFACLAFWFALNQFRWERYMRAVGVRRDEALQGTRFSVVSVQPLAQFPVPATVRLRINKPALLITSLIMLVGIAIMVFGLTLFSGPHTTQDKELNSFIILLFSFIICVIVCGLLYFSLSLPYNEQRIEITDQGIKSCFMRQERFLRWDEIRLFATYESEDSYSNGNSAAKLQIYEVSNEQMVIRWSQISVGNLFLSVQSNLGEKEDWNWLLGRVNAFVADHTRLPLVNLGEDKQRDSIGQARRAEESTSAQLAKSDPLINRLEGKGGSRSIGWVLGIFSLFFIVLGLLGNIPATAAYFSILSGGPGYVMLSLGILCLLCTFLIIMILQASRLYWQRIGHLRQVAFQYPARYKASQQPDASEELPQPSNIRIRAGGKALISAMVTTFVIYFIVNFNLHYFSDEHKSLTSLLISTLVTSVIYAVFTGFMTFLVTRNTNQQRVEVTPNGITTHMYNMDSSLHWQDVRLFARYKSQRWFKNSAKLYVYELAGEDVVVRITMPVPAAVKGNKVEPKMALDELERWYAQLYGYVTQRTNLPLLDLDSGDQVK